MQNLAITNLRPPSISVIVPFYNSASYLNRCLSSLARQENPPIFEVLLIDDGSDDDPLPVINRYLKNRPRWRYYRKTNGGTSSARNYGLDLSSGEYIFFMDSDDYLPVNSLATLYSEAINRGSDIVIGNAMAVSDDLLRPIPLWPHRTKDFIAEGHEMLAMLQGPDGAIFVTVWNKLWRKNLFSQLRFEEGTMHEDYLIVHRLYLMSRNQICFVPSITYYYVNRLDSITKSHDGFYWRCLCKVYLSTAYFYIEHGYDDLCGIIIWNAFVGLSKHRLWGRDNIAYYDSCRREIKAIIKLKRIASLPVSKITILLLFRLFGVNVYSLFRGK